MAYKIVWWRATADEDGHYSFAVALWCRGPPRAPIAKSATPCDLALRHMGGCPPDFAGAQIGRAASPQHRDVPACTALAI